MELYLDSANLTEINEAFQLGFLTGLTTTPTFMHREGVKDLDKTILDLAKTVPILQIEALGNTADEVVKEAERQLDLGLKKDRTVFKIPVSLEGVKACRMLRNKGMMVNIHLVYTLQQAYMAIAAGASYVCPLVGRLQDQGQDALSLVTSCVDIVERYGYDSKIMFSSVRNMEHVRNALEIGVHACTVPWKIIKTLTDNHFTTIGTKEFFEHTNLITIKVKDVYKSAPKVMEDSVVLDALIEMTKSKLGAVAIVDSKMAVKGVFTDGDLRRAIKKNGEKLLQTKVAEFKANAPLSVLEDATLDEAWQIFKSKKIDNLVVLSKDNKYKGMLDLQDLLEVISGAKV